MSSRTSNPSVPLSRATALAPDALLTLPRSVPCRRHGCADPFSSHHAPPTTHSAVRLRGVPNKGIFVLAYSDITSPAVITWDGNTAHLGQVLFNEQTWNVHAHLDADRYARYELHNRPPAAPPALINGPDTQVITYPVDHPEEANTRLLFHALDWLSNRAFHQDIPWQPRGLPDGRTIHEATIATVIDGIGTVPIVAWHDQAMIDVANGDVRDVVIRIGEEADRKFILPVNSTNITRCELFRRLSEHGSLC